MLNIKKSPREDSLPIVLVEDETIVSLVADMIGVGEVYDIFAKSGNMVLAAIGRNGYEEIVSLLGTASYLLDNHVKVIVTRCRQIPWESTVDCSEHIYDLPLDASVLNIYPSAKNIFGFRAIDSTGATCRKLKYIDERAKSKASYAVPRKKLEDILEWLFFLKKDQVETLLDLDGECEEFYIDEVQSRRSMLAMEQSKQSFATVF